MPASSHPGSFTFATPVPAPTGTTPEPQSVRPLLIESGLISLLLLAWAAIQVV